MTLNSEITYIFLFFLLKCIDPLVAAPETGIIQLKPNYYKKVQLLKLKKTYFFKEDYLYWYYFCTSTLMVIKFETKLTLHFIFNDNLFIG